MVIREATVPAGTYYNKQDLKDTVIELEPLTTKMYFSYLSVSKSKECSVELDTNKMSLIADSGNFPDEFPLIVRAIYDRITRGTYNKYEQSWGTKDYNKIVKFLEHAKSIIPEEDLDSKVEGSFYFDPDHVLKLRGRLNSENNVYHAQCSPVSVIVDGNDKIFDKEINLYVENDDSVTLELSYFYNGQEKHVQTTKQISNDGNVLESIFKSQTSSEELLLYTLICDD